jgi:eukaryotic-like serine/threonine-protein kinase
MDTSAWERLSRLLDEALDLSPGQRARWLATLAPEHEALKPRLIALLAQATAIQASGFLAALPTLDIEDEDAADDPEDRPGATIGPYRLLRPLGEGGMGTVWLADRTDGLIQRAVALKLPRAAWSRKAIAERLARERDILATLTHPHIARLYDAGVTPAGRPYLALEYVDGQPIDGYCRGRGLDVRQIVAVFAQVVEAVAYAHAKLVVHRDLKPSNILVDDQGQVRLLDFGIAKLIDAQSIREAGLTEVAGCPQTPEYASPEQVTGEPLSTASDVYSLGVVLYELLTGSRPYALKRDSRRAMEAAILQTDVKPPSLLATVESSRRALRGDLDTILLKALKKPPEERYASVSAFGDDLERWIHGRPVLARPDGSAYRLRKFIGRHRVGAAATAVMAIGIVSAASVAIWQASEARAERYVALRETQRANTEAEEARRAARIAQANVELMDYLTADLAVGRSVADLEQQLERAVKVVEQRFGRDPLVRLNLLFGIAGRLRQLSSFDRHRALVADLLAAPRIPGDENAHAQLTCWRARDLSQLGNAAEARVLMDAVLTDLRSRTPLPATLLISCLADDSAMARLAGDSPRAVASVEELARLEESRGLGRTDGYTDTLLILARAYAQAGRYRDADRAAAHSLALRTEIGRAGSTGAANTETVRATILRDGGQPQRAFELLERILARDAARGGTPQSLPTVSYEWALTLIRLGRPNEALERLLNVAKAARTRGDTTLVRASAVARAVALGDAGDLAAARAALDEATPLYATQLAARHYTARLLLFARAHVALAAGDAVAANAAIDEARAIVAGLPNPADPARRWIHAYAARVALRQGRYADARQSIGQALALSEQQAIDPSASLFVGEDLAARAEASLALGDVAAAREDARLAIAHLTAVGATAVPALSRARAIASGQAPGLR